MGRRDEVVATGVAATLLADVALEVGDAATFALLAITSTTGLAGRQWFVLAALILPRLSVAAVGVAILAVRLRRDGGDRLWASAFLMLVAVQAGAGLFLLWGAGRSGPGRVALGLVNLGAALVAARAERRSGRVRPAALSRRPSPEEG